VPFVARDATITIGLFHKGLFLTRPQVGMFYFGFGSLPCSRYSVSRSRFLKERSMTGHLGLGKKPLAAYCSRARRAPRGAARLTRASQELPTMEGSERIATTYHTHPPGLLLKCGSRPPLSASRLGAPGREYLRTDILSWGGAGPFSCICKYARSSGMGLGWRCRAALIAWHERWIKVAERGRPSIGSASE
jgi:hypothetical protein